jgi:glycerol-3-phosphate cytidylyltransferase
MNILSTKIVYIGGTFDLFHVGHVRLLHQCAQNFRDVVVSLNTDEFVERYKHKRPVYTLNERIEILRSCSYVDSVIVNVGCEDSTKSIDVISPDYIAHGDDWTGNSLMRQMGLTEEYMKRKNISFFYVPYTKGISSSQIRKKLS